MVSRFLTDLTMKSTATCPLSTETGPCAEGPVSLFRKIKTMTVITIISDQLAFVHDRAGVCTGNERRVFGQCCQARLVQRRPAFPAVCKLFLRNIDGQRTIGNVETDRQSLSLNYGSRCLSLLCPLLFYNFITQIVIHGEYCFKVVSPLCHRDQIRLICSDSFIRP